MSKSTVPNVVSAAQVAPSFATAQAYIDGLAPDGWHHYVLKAAACYNHNDAHGWMEAMGVLLRMVANDKQVQGSTITRYITPPEPILN